jgi:hypothetical protein
LLDFSRGVLDILNKDGLVIVGGESGLGKSELFLGTKSKYKAGGLADLLSEEGRPFQYFDAQSHARARRQMEEIIEMKREDKPSIILIDESLVMLRSPEIKFDIVKKLLEGGRKVVLVGGGRAKSSEQNQLIKDGVESLGIKVGPRQIFEFPPYVLNRLQSEQVLKINYPDLTSNEAGQVIASLDKQNIPRIFRALLNSHRNPEWNTRSSMTGYIGHIRVEPQ